MAFHPAFPRLQNAKALVLVYRARHDRRLLADDPFTDDFGINAVSDGVMYEPATAEELCSELAHVLDTHEVRKNVMALRRLRVVAQIYGPPAPHFFES